VTAMLLLFTSLKTITITEDTTLHFKTLC